MIAINNKVHNNEDRHGLALKKNSNLYKDNML